MHPEIKEIANSFTNTRLKKIVNVYQTDYKNMKSPGLGDFLRGCFCLMQVCRLINVEFDIDISQHPLSKYIENPTRVEGVDYNNIHAYMEHNRRNGKNNYETVASNINPSFLRNIINYFNSQNCETLGLFSNAFPSFNIYSQIGKELIKSRLRPNEYMRNYVDFTLNQIGLSKKGYGVIHIRSGDKYLVNGEVMSESFMTWIDNIIKHYTFPDRRYLIISDCNIIKKYLKSHSNFYIYVRAIEHLGGEALKSIETNGIMNTMLDFFLMEHSNAILSLSVYDHVSGFSKYSSILNDIPFKYIKL
ncbi:MAG: hypothetical protein EBY20_00255 [Alphaproteobacteria bacterium]|uniref:Uncharacterized protein n=1 Tax=viral metagenome TaxID=1070528 RepID=A0A6C0HR42_9ZZZZ|nr:hypothetical protein [Alphaproteobacteria bacterium]